MRPRRRPARAASLAAAAALLGGACGGAAPEALGRAALPTELSADGEGGSTDPSIARTGPKLVVTPKGVVLPVVQKEGDRWRVLSPCGQQVVTSGKAVGDVEVVLDPGHGGEEPGAVAPNGLREKDLNLVVAARTAEALQKAGVKVVLTRRADYRTTLSTRGAIAKAAEARAFVSIHFNAGATNPSPTPGTEVYHQARNAEAKRLGGNVYGSLYGALDRIQGQRWVAAERPGVQLRLGQSGDDYYGVLRAAGPVPAVLVEVAFMSNPPEAALLARKDAQQAIGESVAAGILSYLRTDAPGTGFVDPGTAPVESRSGGGSANGCEDPQL